MKKTVYALLLLLSISTLKAQETPKPDFKNMNPEQRKEYLKSLSPEQRIKLLEESETRMVIKILQIPEEKQETFKKLYGEYHQSQKLIFDKFNPEQFQRENLSDAEAKKMLEQSFNLGEQLIADRRAFSEKFLKILTPQQVLKLFNHEKKMREKQRHERDRKEPPQWGNPPKDGTKN